MMEDIVRWGLLLLIAVGAVAWCRQLLAQPRRRAAAEDRRGKT